MNISMLLELPAATAGDQEVLLDDELRVTYATLRDDVARIAALLRVQGVGPGDRVGVFAMSSVRMVEVVLASAAIEAIAVPMNYRARDAELRHLLSDSSSRVVFVDARYEADVRAAAPACTDVVRLDDPAFVSALREVEPEEEFASIGDDALRLYTSGTTALPKAVRLTHEGLTSFVLSAADVADGTDRGTTVIAVPLYHVAGLTTFLVSLFTGRRMYLQRDFSPRAWLDAVERHRVTDAFLVPTMLKRILDEDFSGRDLSSVRLIRYGAAPMPEKVLLRALDRFPAGVDFMGAYGLTETTSTVAVLGPEDHGPEALAHEVGRQRLTSVGRVLDDVEIEIRDDDERALPVGAVGRVCLRTGRGMVGYAQAGAGGDLAAASWFETGDLGYLDDEGYLFLVGRAGDMIIRGGENIAPQEVEEVLLQHPAITEAAVVGVEDEEWGQRVVAAVVTEPGAGLSEHDVVEFCRGRLAGFRRPETVFFVDELPHTTTGKLMRRRVLEDVTG